MSIKYAIRCDREPAFDPTKSSQGSIGGKAASEIRCLIPHYQSFLSAPTANTQQQYRQSAGCFLLWLPRCNDALDSENMRMTPDMAMMASPTRNGADESAAVNAKKIQDS